jgi:hypothetical protein
VKSFANWYNGEHLHSAIRFVAQRVILSRFLHRPAMLRPLGVATRSAGEFSDDLPQGFLKKLVRDARSGSGTSSQHRCRQKGKLELG